MKRRKRAVSDEERLLFENTFKDAVPFDASSLKRKKAAPAKAKPLLAESTTPKSLIRMHTGIDGHTAERLRRGMLEPEARLDLHGLAEDSAHRALVTFLRSASARGLHLVIVVTGKGLKPAAANEPFDLGLSGKARGVLKTMTPRWLGEPELARFVADVRSAHSRHGGAGAFYVYLRKSKV